MPIQHKSVTRVVAIIQARTGSTRLPGKVLMDLAGEPMLARVVNRASRAATVHEVLVATTIDSQDDRVEQLCGDRSWKCFRGSEHDVLDRYYRAAIAFQCDVVVRITSDCPFIDPSLVDECVSLLLADYPHIDYVSNSIPQETFPRGLDAEVMRFRTLEAAWQEDKNPAWREHVTQYILRNPTRFNLRGLSCDSDYSSFRWTVDTAEDLELARRIYASFGHDRFHWREVLALMEQHPHWIDINRHIEQKVVV